MHEDPQALIERLRLEPHPEGGWYRETWRAPAAAGTRSPCTVINFLLRAGERSHWHRVDADEIWCHNAGHPLTLEVSLDGRRSERHLLGGDAETVGQTHAAVPANAWQAASSAGAWSLVTCVVAPGFDFDGFELAPPGWAPGSG